MLDRLYLPFLALVAVAAVALALNWPQGLGDRSPDPFGSVPVQRTPEMQAAMKREAEAVQRHTAQAKASLQTLRSQTLAPPTPALTHAP